WLAPNLPEVKLTDHGAVMDAPQPFVLTHPVLGTLLVIDTRRETPSTDDLRGAPLFVSRTQLVVSEGQAGQRRVYDLVPQTPDAGRVGGARPFPRLCPGGWAGPGRVPGAREAPPRAGGGRTSRPGRDGRGMSAPGPPATPAVAALLAVTAAGTAAYWIAGNAL